MLDLRRDQRQIMYGAPTTGGIRGKVVVYQVTLTVTSLDSFRWLVLFWTEMEKFQPSSCFGACMTGKEQATAGYC